jgi:hypothetical protein
MNICFQYKSKLVIIFAYIVIILFIISNSVAQQENINSIPQKSSFNSTCNIPKLAWHPKSHDFGFVQEGNMYNTTFEIWNNGTGSMEWSLQVKDNWVYVNPKFGESTGERDIINVSITTNGLNPGNYEGNVYIHSEGDYIYYTYFVITESKLSFYPKFFDIGVINQNEEKNIYFEIWNKGKGILNWSLITNSEIIEISPTYGSSIGEHNLINITIKPNTIDSGLYNEKIEIISNGGNGFLYVNFSINNPPLKPTIEGKTKTKSDIELLYEIQSFDKDGDKISYYIDWGDTTYNNWSNFISSGTKYNITKIWTQNGFYSIMVKARDVYNYESEWGIVEVEVPKRVILSNSFFYFNNILLKFL